MSATRALRAIVVFAILVLLHFTVRPLLAWRAEPDFLVIAILVSAVRLRPGAAAALGFATGLAADALSPEAFGAGAMALTMIGFAASWLKAVFFADNLALNGFFFFLGKWATDLLLIGLERRLVGMEAVYQGVLWSPLAAAVTAVTGVLFLLFMRPVMEASQP